MVYKRLECGYVLLGEINLYLSGLVTASLLRASICLWRGLAMFPFKLYLETIPDVGALLDIATLGMTANVVELVIADRCLCIVTCR